MDCNIYTGKIFVGKGVYIRTTSILTTIQMVGPERAERGIVPGATVD